MFLRLRTRIVLATLFATLVAACAESDRSPPQDAGVGADADSADAMDDSSDAKDSGIDATKPCGSGNCPANEVCWCTDPVVCCPMGTLCYACPDAGDADAS